MTNKISYTSVGKSDRNAHLFRQRRVGWRTSELHTKTMPVLWRVLLSCLFCQLKAHTQLNRNARKYKTLNGRKNSGRNRKRGAPTAITVRWVTYTLFLRFGYNPAMSDPASKTAPITPAGILELGLGFWASKTLLSAIELGVFIELARTTDVRATHGASRFAFASRA